MNSSKLLLFFFFALLLSAASAQVHVLLSPSTGKGIQTLYLDEVFGYDVIVVNLGQETEAKLVVRVEVEDALVLLKDEKPVKELSFELDEILAGERIIEKIFVKPIELKTKENKIFAYYGVEQFTNASSTFLYIKENPVEINARLSKTALDLGEPGSLIVNLKNSSQGELKNINASLITSEGLLSESEPLVFNSLAPKQGFSDKEFFFTPLAGVTGKKELTLRVSYADSTGIHRIEKTFLVDIQNRNFTLYLIVGVIGLLIVLSYVIGRKPGKSVQLPKSLKPEEKLLVEKKEI